MTGGFFKRLCGSGAAALLLVALAAWAQPHASEADLGHFDVTATAITTSTAPGAARGITTAVTIPAGDLRGGEAIQFEPTQVVITPGCNKPGFRDFDNNGSAGPGETPCLTPGDAAGTQTSSLTLGLLNGACNTLMPVTVALFDIALPNNQMDPRLSTNIVYPRPQGSTDRFGGWQVGSEPAPAGGTAPVDTNLDGMAEAGSLAVQNYPSYLLDLFDADGPAGAAPALPLAVYGGLTRTASEWTPVYFAQFAAGVLTAAFAGDAPHLFSRGPAAVGHPGVPVTGDPTATLVSPSQITDVCSPMTTTTQLNATVGLTTRATNPPVAGTYFSLVWQGSQRDLDNDGFENTLDACPRNADTATDPDGDRLDSACDPTPAVNTGPNDHDGDAFLNGLDNCPLVSNGTQADSESLGANGVAAFDGGVESDGIGDACDGPSAVSVTVNTTAYTITPASTVGNGHWHAKGLVVAICYGGTDADADGYCAGAQDPADSGACATMFTPPNCAVRHSGWLNTPAFAHLLLFDTDRGGGDTAGPSDPGGIGVGIVCPTGTPDICPEVGFDSDWMETYMGTDPTMACAQNTGPDNEPQDNWWVDVNDDGAPNTSDLVAFGGQIGVDAFGKSYNAPFNTFVDDTVLPNTGTPRFDHNADGASNISDLIAQAVPKSKFCNRVDGTNGTVQ